MANTGFNFIQKEFEVDFDKVKTLEDLIIVVKGLNLKIFWNQEDCPDKFKEICEAGLLKEIIKTT